MPVESQDLGARVIWEGKQLIKADLFFVHGLSGHPIKTWSIEPQKQNKKLALTRLFKRDKGVGLSDAPNSTSVFWPRDLLPEDVPNVRIISYGYESEVLKMFATANTNNLFQHAQNMLADIQRIRSENPERPAIFVCHSLGGILTKEALRLSRAATYQPSLQGLYKQTYGVIFLGTPHRGSTWAPWGALMGNLAKLALQSPNTSLLRSLEVDSMALQMIADEFSTMIRGDITVYSFREERGMFGIYGLHDKIVDDFSSIIGDAAEGKEGIDANHRDMCKYASRSDNGYRKVSGEIRRFVNAVSNGNQIKGNSDIENWPDFVPTQTRRKILRDKLYNHINFGGDNSTATLILPVLDLSALTASSGYNVPKTLYFGSSVFELADVLQLLPGQANSDTLSVEEIPLADIICDERTYYSKISQTGLLRLVCQHFHSISETGNELSVRTNIGTFQFARTENGNTVRFAARERSATCIAPKDQDFDSLQESALGRFCIRENFNSDYFMKDAGIAIGPPEWISMRPNIAITHSDLDHRSCIRFMTAQDYDEINREERFVDRILDLIFQVLEQRLSHFDDYTKEGLGIVKTLSMKVLTSPEHLGIATAACKWVLSGAARAPADELVPLAQQDSEATTVSGTLEGIRPEAQRSHEDSTQTAIRVRSKTETTTKGITRHPPVIGSPATQTDSTGLDLAAQRLVVIAAQELQNLEALNSTSDDAMRTRIEHISDSQPRILAILAAIQIVRKANAKIIRTASAPVPERWLQLLGAADTDTLIG